MSAWGRTGRVTVKRCGRFHDPEHDRTVRVDGKRTGGTVAKVTGSDDWFVEMFGPEGQSWSDGNLPSLDAAVLWVLRRVDPALWRQERGEVWSVRKLGRRGAVIEPWHIHRAPETPRRFENCGCEDDLHEDSHSEQADALRAALAYISKAALR